MKIRLLIFLLFCVSSMMAQDSRSLDFYKTIARVNNPALFENKNLQRSNQIQQSIILSQFRKPIVNLTAGYLFAPFLFNNRRFISITQNPERNAYGYDVSLSNGGLYSAQVGAAIPLLAGGIMNTYLRQNSLQVDLLVNKNDRLLHELDYNIAIQYITIYQIQQFILFQQNIISLVEDRKSVEELLVQKGLLPQSEYLLLEIEMKQRRVDIQQLKINLANAFGQLNSICAVSDTTVYTVAEPSISETPLQDHYQFQKKYQLDSTSISVQQDVFNLKYKPQLAAFGNAGLNASTTDNISHYTGFSAGLQLVVPISDGGQRKKNSEQTRLLLENNKQYEKQNQLEVKNNLEALQRQIVLTRESVTLISSELNTQEIVLQMIKDKIITGQVSVTDYLNALQNYVSSNQNKIQTLANLWLLINTYNYYNW